MTTTTRPTRRSMSLAAFQRFEPHIAQACTGSFTVDPSAMSPPLRPNSYVSAARDALRGYELHHHPSTLIPPGYDTGRIKVREWEDGLVKWENLYEDRQTKFRGKLPSQPAPLDSSCSVVIRDGKVLEVRQREKPTDTIWLVDPTAEETGRILTRLASGALNGFSTLVLASPICGEVYRTAHLALDWESLAEGWWRVT